MAATVASFRTEAVPNGSGQSRGSWSSARRFDTRESAHRFFKRYGKVLRQQLRGAVGHDHHIVFAAHTKLTRNVNAGLIGKSHARQKVGPAAADKIGVFVAIEADAVTQAMRKEFVVGAVAGA